MSSSLPPGLVRTPSMSNLLRRVPFSSPSEYALHGAQAEAGKKYSFYKNPQEYISAAKRQRPDKFGEYEPESDGVRVSPKTRMENWLTIQNQYKIARDRIVAVTDPETGLRRVSPTPVKQLPHPSNTSLKTLSRKNSLEQFDAVNAQSDEIYTKEHGSPEKGPYWAERYKELVETINDATKKAMDSESSDLQAWSSRADAQDKKLIAHESLNPSWKFKIDWKKPKDARKQVLRNRPPISFAFPETSPSTSSSTRQLGGRSSGIIRKNASHLTINTNSGTATPYRTADSPIGSPPALLSPTNSLLSPTSPRLSTPTTLKSRRSFSSQKRSSSPKIRSSSPKRTTKKGPAKFTCGGDSSDEGGW